MRCNFAVCLALAFLVAVAPAQQAVQANADPTYQALRRISIGTDTAGVTNFVLKRDAATFTFKSGTFHLLSPVAGKVTGAVFIGDGEFNLMPPIPAECKMLSLFTKDPKPGITESFTTVVLRFTDDTVEQIKKAASGSASSATGNVSGALNDSQDDARKKLRWNISARILQDVLSTEPGGFFAAFIHGKKYDGHELFVIDPHGALGVDPEEIEFLSYSDTKSGMWAAFHSAPEYASGTARGTEQNAAFAVERQNLDTKIDKNGMLHGNAATTVMSGVSGLRAVGFDLFPTLRVQKVTDDAGTALAFIQEDKNDDPDYWVILPKALSPGEKFTIHTVYEGKDAVRNEGAGNYDPVARSSWYPSTGFGHYANYEMRFSVAKNITLVATGDLVSQKMEGDQNVSIWKTAVPQAVAGFNLGEYKRIEAKMQKSGYLIEAYANKQAPDAVRALQQDVEGDLPGDINRQRSSGYALGTMSTTALMDKPLAEAQLSVGLYNDYFGAIPYKRISMTQQTPCRFGQSWPGVVYMPICSFFDATVRHQLGLDDTRGYWKSVAAHEVAHQWWGHAVGFNSYRDQWMSEGFAEFSASLYLQLIQKNQKEFIRWWDDQRELLTERNKEGFRAIDAGPLTAGYRLANTRSGFDIPRRLIYPKGGFVLHMIRMMMWEPKTGDERFRALMQDFVKTYSNQSASAEDFKAMVEKHMIPAMDLDGNGKMDWFFNEYVYGTELPTYKVEASFTPGEDTVFLNLKLTQSNVSPEFRMLVPLYLELADGRILRLGSAPLRGNTAIDQKIPLNGLKAVPKRAMVNYFDDVLSIVQ